MKNNIYLTCGVMALAFAACSEDNGIVGTSTEPNTFAQGSSSSEAENSSSSDFGLSSSAAPLTSSSAKMTSSSSVLPESSSSLFGLSSSHVEPYSSALTSSSSSAGPLSSSSSNPVLCKTSLSGAGCAGIYYEGDVWDPEKYIAAVETNKYADDSSKFGIDAGKWYWKITTPEGGESTVEWLAGSLDSAVTQAWGWEGLAGVAHLVKGNLTYSPFVDIGFNVAGFDSNGVALSADISNWNGICIAYKSDVAIALILDLGDSINKDLDWGMPSVSLTKASGLPTDKCVKWSDFKMPGWVKKAKYKISGEEAAKQVVGIMMRIQAQAGNYGFSILAVGSNRDE